jgi:putative membrane protein
LTMWHVPTFYQAAIRNDLLHAVEHFSMLGAAMLFWWSLLRCGKPGGMAYPVGAIFVFTTTVYHAVLGAMIAFSGTPWYPLYAATVQSVGLTPTDDQNLAGVIMWIPGKLIYLTTVLVLLWSWFKEMDKRERRQALQWEKGTR